MNRTLVGQTTQSPNSKSSAIGKIHKTLRVTPAMQAGLIEHVWSFEELANMIDATIEKPTKRGPYKKQSA